MLSSAASSGCFCQLQRTDTGEVCGRSLDDSCSHCVSCRFGQGVLRLHSGLQTTLLEACRAAGCFAWKEVVVPAWARPRPASADGAVPARMVKAWLDVVADDARGTSYFIDATIRNPLVKRYLESNSGSAHVTGHACRVAAEEAETVSTLRWTCGHHSCGGDLRPPWGRFAGAPLDSPQHGLQA